MVPTLATSSPPAWESRITKANRSTFAIVMSQNAEIPSRPWWPLPSSSNPDGPTGSSTTAAGSKRASQRCLSPAVTASIDRSAASRAGGCCASTSQHTVTAMLPPFRGPSEPLDDLVGELLDGVLLPVDRGVESEAVERPRHGDHVGDADLGLFAVSVETEPVDAHGLELEGLVGAAVLGAQRVQPRDRLAQVVELHHRRRPAVADARGPAQRGFAVAADVERHVPRRCRTHAQLVEVEELTVVLDHPAAEDQPENVDRLVDTPAPSAVRHAAPLELLRRPADPESETEPVAREVRDGPHLAGQQHGIART